VKISLKTGMTMEEKEEKEKEVVEVGKGMAVNEVKEEGSSE